MKERESGEVQPLRLKLDPGSKKTGVALLNEVTKKVVFAMEIEHRGMAISMNLKTRHDLRGSRRSRNTRYRKPGLPNTTKPQGWIAPSLMHRILIDETWVRRLRNLAPITALSMELNKFDMQLMQNPDISGVQYQQGTLAGYEVKEYLLETLGRSCTYCDAKKVPLQVEHIQCKARGGSGRISNLALACEPCNTKKGTRDIRDFLKDKPALLKKILAQTKTPLRDAAAVNSTRWALYERLKSTGLPIETGSGGRTKFNRTQQGYPKAHWIDAACVGESGASVIFNTDMKPLQAKATGHGNRQMCGTDKYGFPTRHRSNKKTFMGFQTGDLVRAVVPRGKCKGTHTGRIAIRQRPSFRMGTFDVHPKYLTIIQRADGYEYK